MKKIYVLALAMTIGLIGCNKDEISGSEDANLEAVAHKYRKKKKECEISLTPDLPAIVNACTTAKGADANNAYFDLTINDTSLQGDHSAWCVDVDLSLGGDQCFEAEVYSSYEPLPEGKFEHPENFDLVNWIMNQDFLGTSSPSGGTYTFGDIQWAIWELIDDRNCISCAYLGDDWSVAKGQEIVDLAIENGEGYEPGEGDDLVVVLVPKNNLQSVFITYKLECPDSGDTKCETAYARDTNGENCFIDNGFSRWGWSIQIPETGVYTYDIYAGAGQCDINKGELAGKIEVNYSDNGELTVEYIIENGYTLSETHTYAGYDMFPTGNSGNPTVAPGQYSIQENLSGEIFVIAHAEVCKSTSNKKYRCKRRCKGKYFKHGGKWKKCSHHKKRRWGWRGWKW